MVTSNADEIDLKILDILREDARTNLKNVAKSCSITASAVLKRVNKLKANGIILGTYLQLRPDTFGFPQEATIGITTESSKIDDITTKVHDIPNVIVCAKSIGRYNLFAHVFTKDLPELEKVTYAIKSIHGVRAISVNIHIEKCAENDPKIETNTIQKEHGCNPDEKDLKIIDELLKDPEASFGKIGNCLILSHETVRKRYERMKKEGVLKCTLIIDRSKIGYQGTAFFLISCSETGSKEQAIAALRDMKVFNSIDKVIGGAFDLFASTATRDLRDLCGLVDKIQKIPSIENVETGLLLFTYYSYIPKPGSPYKCDTVGLS